MKICLKFEKGNIGRLFIAMVLAAALYHKVSFPIAVLAGFGVAYFFIKSLEIEVDNAWVKNIGSAVLI